MLNELLEYQQYTYPLETEHPAIRLKHKTLCNQLSGTTRSMTVIARKSVFDHSSSERIERTKNGLRVWCGDPKGKPDEASENIVDAWLPNYMINHLGEEKAIIFEQYLMTEPGLDHLPRYSEVCDLFKDVHDDFRFEVFLEKDKREALMDKAKRLELFCKELGEDEKQRKKSINHFSPVYNIMKALVVLIGRYGSLNYNKEMFNLNLARVDKNDFKKIMYDKIIADAITAGPLKRYYLVCDHADFSQIRVKTAKKTTYPFQKTDRQGRWSMPTTNKADLIMKTIAAFLLEQEFRNAENTYEGQVPVVLTDIANWLAGNTKVEKKELEKFGIESGPLFTLDLIDNVATIGIDTEWMKSCGWRVIPEDQLDDYLSGHPDAVFYRDDGAGQFLQKGVRY